jgi:hypothetical protein
MEVARTALPARLLEYLFAASVCRRGIGGAVDDVDFISDATDRCDTPEHGASGRTRRMPAVNVTPVVRARRHLQGTKGRRELNWTPSGSMRVPPIIFHALPCAAGSRCGVDHARGVHERTNSEVSYLTTHTTAYRVRSFVRKRALDSYKVASSSAMRIVFTSTIPVLGFAQRTNGLTRESVKMPRLAN